MESTVTRESSAAQLAVQDQEKNSKYQDGQILRFIRVRFPGHAHSYPFILGRRQLSYGQKVMALSDRGMTVGYVNSFPYEVAYSGELEPVRTISRIALEEDELATGTQEGQEKEIEVLCKELIKKHQLEMNLTHVELTGYGKKAVFYFTAPQRVDFRGLVRDLVSQLKMKIELRQISVRERAAALGGLGPCGRALCCSTFLKSYGNVSIKMAKVQNLTLVPSKLNGLCGQLKCCLSYEEEVYQEKRDRLPQENQLIEVANGDRGKVLHLHVFGEQFDMLTDRGVIRRYHYNQYQPKKYQSPADWKMSEEFNHVSYETSQVIGLPQQTLETPHPFQEEVNVKKQGLTELKDAEASKYSVVKNSQEATPPLTKKPIPKQPAKSNQSDQQNRVLKAQKNNPFKRRKRSKNRPHGRKKN